MMSIRSGQVALRSGRCSVAGHYYLITTCTYAREPLLTGWHQARQITHTLRELDQEQRAMTQTFVVMPDHLHWLFQLGDEHSLAQVVQRLKGRSARRINMCLNRQGQVWQTGYHDHAIRQEEDIKQIARYVVANPLRAGLVDDIGQYPHWDAAWL